MTHSMETAGLVSGVRQVRHCDVLIAYSGQEVGNVDPRFGPADEVMANRAKLLSGLNYKAYIAQIPQAGSEFLDLSGVADDDLSEEYPTDGLIINRPNVALMLNPADCIAMALYSRSKNDTVLGVIHAGRQGIDGGIHQSSVRHVVDAHDVLISDVRAYFSPCISSDSYFYPNISSDQLADPKWKKFIDKRGGNYHIDLAGRAVKDLVELGLEPSQIDLAGIDVGAAGSGYFSHARGKSMAEPEGRNGFVAMLEA